VNESPSAMIKLTRLNGKPFFVNALYIETVESFPDTAILLTNGKRYVVKEEEEQVVEAIKRFYQEIGLLGRNFWKDDDVEE